MNRLLQLMADEDWDADTAFCQFDNLHMKSWAEKLYTYGRCKDEIGRIYETRIDGCAVPA